MLEILFKIGKKFDQKRDIAYWLDSFTPKQVVLGSSPKWVGIFVFIFYQ